MTTARRLLVAAAGAALAMSGCSSDGEDPASESEAPVVQLGGPGESNRTLSSEEVEGLDQPAHTEDDVAFVQGMIPHHRQALEMTAMVAGRTASMQVPRLSERIEISQIDEIAQLENWLTDRDEELPDAHAHHHGGHVELMPGMLNEAELAMLRDARGQRFDRLFLSYMIRHHEGAVRMVEELLAAGGGQEPEVFQLAQHIESDQLVEISRMKRMLADGSF